jgi:hypothetical protein
MIGMIGNHSSAPPAWYAAMGRGTLATALIAFVMWTSDVAAQQQFKSPEEAADALASAARAGDRKGVLAVLGRDATDIVSSGDEVADANARQLFLQA